MRTAAAPYVFAPEVRLIPAAVLMLAGVVIVLSAATGYWPRRV
jgi:hypothetical protein